MELEFEKFKWEEVTDKELMHLCRILLVIQSPLSSFFNKKTLSILYSDQERLSEKHLCS